MSECVEWLMLIVKIFATYALIGILVFSLSLVYSIVETLCAITCYFCIFTEASPSSKALTRKDKPVKPSTVAPVIQDTTSWL